MPEKSGSIPSNEPQRRKYQIGISPGGGLFLFAALWGLRAFGQPANGSIQGVILDDAGSPLRGAFVTAYRIQPIPSVSAQDSSSSSGSFNVQRLPAGTYRLCAQVAGGALLDPCQWSLKQTEVTLATGQISRNNTLQLRRGSRLWVRLNDPNRTLQTPNTRGVPPRVVMGVWSPASPFYPLRRVQTDSLGEDYEVTIPFDSPVRFSIVKSEVRMTDEAGNVVSLSGFAEVVRHTTGEVAPRIFSFTVTGRAP